MKLINLKLLAIASRSDAHDEIPSVIKTAFMQGSGVLEFSFQNSFFSGEFLEDAAGY